MPLTSDCLTGVRIQQFREDELPLDELAQMEEHLGRCPNCQRLLDGSAADANEWCDLRETLSDTQGTDQDHELGESSSLRPLLSLLGPTDDPRMLGRIGTYEIVGVLGRGGMGVVFKGFDGALNRYVAIKMLLPHLATTAAARKRFAREAQAAAAVVDEHVMPIHGVAEWQGVPYLVMPYARGMSLQKRLAENGPLQVREILRIGMQTAAALAAAHAQGLVHRDVKPANIMLEESVERVLLTDFGLARAVDDIGLTRTGVVAGTPQYMSPEQARGQAVDARSDLFSLGSVLYAMGTGRAPFRAESSYGVLRLITDEEPRPIQEINPDVPTWLCQIIGRLMAKKPEDRFALARDVAQLLERCLAHVQHPTVAPLPGVAPTAGQRPIRTTRYSKGVVIMVALISSCVAGMFLWQATGPQEISGHWSSQELGAVSLTLTEPGEYRGTYTKTHNDQLGDLRLTWSRMERRFNGAWKEGADCHGEVSLRLVKHEIRGSYTLDASSRAGSDVKPRLGDFQCVRAEFGGARNFDPKTDRPTESEHVGQKADDSTAEPKPKPGEILVELHGGHGMWNDSKKIGKLIAALTALKGVRVNTLEFGLGDVVSTAIVRDPWRVGLADASGTGQKKSTFQSAINAALAEYGVKTVRWKGGDGEPSPVGGPPKDRSPRGLPQETPKSEGQPNPKVGQSPVERRTELKPKPGEIVVELYAGRAVWMNQIGKLLLSLNALKGVKVNIRESGPGDSIALAIVRDAWQVCRKEAQQTQKKSTLQIAINAALAEGGAKNVRWEEGDGEPTPAGISPIEAPTVNPIGIGAPESNMQRARQQTVQNLHVLMSALHKYYEDPRHGRFPPAAVMGKDGKGKVSHSWRVAILPYLGETKLYNEYAFDEPWDSKHNRALLSRMPAIFRSPRDKVDSTNASYLGVVTPGLQPIGAGDAPAAGSADAGGPVVLHYYHGTLFSNPAGTRYEEIPDGTSNTIALVEARREIPWTKPEDIPYYTDKPLPNLGGWFAQGWHAGFADGKVKMLAPDNDETTIRRLFTVGDGHPTQPKFIPLPARGSDIRPQEGLPQPKLSDAPAELPLEGDRSQESAKLRIRKGDGSSALFNDVTEVQVGFPRSGLPSWVGWPNRDGVVSLDKLSSGKHWLLAAGDSGQRTLFQVTLPSPDRDIEKRLRTGRTWANKNFEVKPSVVIDERDREFGEIIVMEIRNFTKDSLLVSEEDVQLRTELRGERRELALILSPGWLTGDRERFAPITVEAGQTGQLRLYWQEWVKRGLWTKRNGPITEPGLPPAEPGRIWLRVGVGNTGFNLVAVRHPEVKDPKATGAGTQP